VERKGIKGRRLKIKERERKREGKEGICKKVQILVYGHALKQNILQFTTESV